ncbi:MAG: hypothetical protein AAGD25_11670 [Cyanobacteria bacterium P01_F01_bin.150]
MKLLHDSSFADRSQLHHRYFERYEHLLTLPSEALIALLVGKEEKAQQLARLLDTAIVQPKTHIDTFENQGDTTMSESNTGTPKFDLRGAKIAGGVAETVQGDQVGGTQYNYDAPEKQDLAEAAAEIQRLLKQLESTNPAATEADQKAFVSAALPATLKQRAVSALKSGGKTVLEEVLDKCLRECGPCAY